MINVVSSIIMKNWVLDGTKNLIHIPSVKTLKSEFFIVNQLTLVVDNLK